MNPSDDTTVPLSRPIESVHPIAAALLNAPKDQQSGLCPPNYLPKKQDDPAVASGVLDLKAQFAHALSPSEVAFHTPPKPPCKPEGSAPKNFLQAHMVIIDQLLMDPAITTTRLASVTGYSANWLHKLMNSDAFQAKLAEKQKAICDPIVYNTIKDRLQGLAGRTLEILEERMESGEVSLDNAMAVFGLSAKALGIGQAKAVAPVVQQFVVHVPPRMESASAWASAHSGRPAEVQSEPLPMPVLTEEEYAAASVGAASGATEQSTNEKEV